MPPFIAGIIRRPALAYIFAQVAVVAYLGGLTAVAVRIDPRLAITCSVMQAVCLAAQCGATVMSLRLQTRLDVAEVKVKILENYRG